MLNFILLNLASEYYIILVAYAAVRSPYVDVDVEIIIRHFEVGMTFQILSYFFQ